MLPPDEVTIHDGIPVTTPARTLLDLAPLLIAHHLERAATEAEFRRLTSPTSLGALVARYPNRPGTPAIRKLLEQQRIGSARTRSDVETRFLALLDAAALPRPVVNGTVALDPPHNPEVDFHWPRARLVVEIDTFGTHGTRHAFEEDRIRDRALQLAGYKVFRITDRQLERDPSGIARQLGTSLTQGAP